MNEYDYTKEEGFDVIKEFKTLEEVVNSDHEERLKRIEKNLGDWSITGIKESFEDEIARLQAMLAIGDHYPDVKDMSPLQLLSYWSVHDNIPSVWFEAWNEFLGDALGFVGKTTWKNWLRTSIAESTS